MHYYVVRSQYVPEGRGTMEWLLTKITIVFVSQKLVYDVMFAYFL